MFIDHSLSISKAGKLKMEKSISYQKSDMSKLPRDVLGEDSDRISEINFKIVGTCTNLEKPFFRLGADPDPAKVRPEHILKLSLKMLKK